ncbi:MAG: NTP transferase domain-containing protein, partial [Actinomycetota bacterium]|nr:NTP transferase domain-containing protein [Actinomycetota bacterium]
MGREKLSLEVEGMPLIERVRDALAGCCHEVLVVG